MIQRAARQRRLNSFEIELLKVQLIDKDVDYAHGIGVRHVVVDRFWKEKALRTIASGPDPLIKGLSSTKQYLLNTAEFLNCTEHGEKEYLLMKVLLADDYLWHRNTTATPLVRSHQNVLDGSQVAFHLEG